jgi:transketolase
VKPARLLGRAALANARLAYQSFRRMLGTHRWQVLERQGARPQRLLWASTSTKDKRYSDLMYVEPLIGPHTVNTMPEQTIAAFADHGRVADTMEQGTEEAVQVMAELEQSGIDFTQVAVQLENEGVQKFIDPFDALMASLEAKRARLARYPDVRPLQDAAQRLRRLVLRMTTQAGSGHPTSCMSCADIIAALFFHAMRWDPSDPDARDVDTFILSKGHAAPILWAALAEAGAIDEDPLTLRKLDSSLEGHPTPANRWVKIATGSLGQGLAAANGIALANRLDKIDARVYCLLGDGESSEGSVWEAAQFAALNKLTNLVAIVDVNALGQSGAAPYGHDSAVLARRFEAFGWHAVQIDGHDMRAILNALESVQDDRPTFIAARTVKGKGVAFLEGKEGWHGKPVDQTQLGQALNELGGSDRRLPVRPRRIGRVISAQPSAAPHLLLDYRTDAQVATREAYGDALVKLGQLVPDIVGLDGDVMNSTFEEAFAKAFPQRFFQCYIAEQNMIGTALGLAASGKIPFAATFACFLTRAFDFIRMAGYSRPAHLVLCGSHAGVSIGEDGPSQMGLEDVAMFRTIVDSTVLCPADAVSTQRLMEQAIHRSGIVYLRTCRPKTSILYGNDDEFPIGGSKTLRASNRDAWTLVAHGIAVHEALAAYDALQAQDITVRVIDAYSVKPLDQAALARAALETRGLITIEDHWVEGGLGEAVCATVGAKAPVYRLAVAGMPHSGRSDELLERHGISRHAIERTVRGMAANTTSPE